MKLKKYPAVQFLEYAAAKLAVAPLYLLPRRAALHVGEWLGEAMYRLMWKRRRLGFHNLTLAFGDELSAAEKERILRLNFRNLGKSLAEVVHFPKSCAADVLARVTITGQEHCAEAFRQGRGMIYLTAHIGNWEMASHAQAASGYPSTIVVRPLDNRFLDRVTTARRTMFGNTLIARAHGLKEILTALKNKAGVGILMDQNTGRSKGIFVDFFGQPACTIPVIAILALRYDVPVVPGFIVRTGFDTHRLHFFPAVEILRTGNKEQDIALNTARFNKIIEDVIRQYPDQWFWIHNRWKTQPLDPA